MTVFTDLVGQPMQWADGVDIGITGWRRQYRIGVPSPDAALIGRARIGRNRIGRLDWEYITDDCHGCDYFHGGGPGEVPEAGELTLRLRNDDERWSSYRNAFYGPGTLIQIVVGNEADPTHPKSQYVGMVTAWVGGASELSKYSWIDITAIEPWGFLAGIERPAVAPAGLDDTAGTRLARLLPDVDWAFNRTIDVDASAAFRCAATDLSANRMVELRKLAQTFDSQIFGRKNGRMFLQARANHHVDELDGEWFDPGAPITLTPVPTGDPTDGTIPFITGSLETSNDDLLLISELTLGQAGGDSTVTYEQSFGKRHQPRTIQILDLCFRDNYADADLDWLGDRILARGAQTYRVSSLELTSLHGEAVIRFLLAAEITQLVADVVGEASAGGERTHFLEYSICRITHHLRPAGVRVEVWGATVEFDVETGSSPEQIADP